MSGQSEEDRDAEEHLKRVEGRFLPCKEKGRTMEQDEIKRRVWNLFEPKASHGDVGMVEMPKSAMNVMRYKKAQARMYFAEQIVDAVFDTALEKALWAIPPFDSKRDEAIQAVLKVLEEEL